MAIKAAWSSEKADRHAAACGDLPWGLLHSWSLFLLFIRPREPFAPILPPNLYHNPRDAFN